MKIVTGVVYISLATGFLSGCDKIQSAPRIINADGRQYIACKGSVWVSNVGGMLSDKPTYKVSFTDLAGKDHTLWSVQDLQVSQPHDNFAPMPTRLPDPSVSVDTDGKPFNDGEIYSWADGSKAKFVSGKWQAVKLENACKL